MRPKPGDGNDKNNVLLHKQLFIKTSVVYRQRIPLQTKEVSLTSISYLFCTNFFVCLLNISIVRQFLQLLKFFCQPQICRRYVRMRATSRRHSDHTRMPPNQARTSELRVLSDTMSFPSAARLVVRGSLVKSLKDNSKTPSTQDTNGNRENLFSTFRRFHEKPES